MKKRERPETGNHRKSKWTGQQIICQMDKIPVHVKPLVSPLGVSGHHITE